MKNTIDLMMSLVKSEITSSEYKCDIEIDEALLNSLYLISKKHDITQLLVEGLESLGALGEESAAAEKFNQALYTAIYRYERIDYELREICALFDANEIPYMKLKGSVIRSYYSKPYLRTSCDIDILVNSKDVERATELLVDQLQYTLQDKEQYDISLFSPSGIHVELHFKLVERGFKPVYSLQNVWESREISRTDGFSYSMSHELYLLYHIYHMSKHFIHGGCGIKPFVDLWIIKNKMGYDEKKAQALLKKNELLSFYIGVMELTEVWFEGKEYTDVACAIEDYILNGGVYGTTEQRIAMSQNQKGGKLMHLLSKIFLSYPSMLIYYPSLKKFPPLFPFYQVRRWFRIAFFGGRHRAMREIKLNNDLSEQKKESARILIDKLDLHSK